MLVPKQQRTGKTRARTGCTTCRARHVKCDETKPSCLRCIKFWGVCEGYEPAEASSRKKKASGTAIGDLGAGTGPRRVALPAKRPSHALSQNETEERYFQLFREQTASTLAGYFKSEVWSRLLLQMCPREEFIRNAIIAIAALDKTMEATGNHSITNLNSLSKPARQTANMHHQIALQYYGKALRLMRTIDPKDVYYLRNTLIGCLVTTCFESFHGNQESALIQAHNGINILFGYKEPLQTSKLRHNMNRNPDADREIEDDLVDMFSRLEFQILTFRDRRSVEQHDSMHKEGLEFLESMPATFTSLAEARMYFDVMTNVIMHWRVRMHHISPALTTFSFTNVESSAPTPSTPPVSSDIAKELQRGYVTHTTIAERFRVACTPIFLAARTKDADGNFPSEYAGATVMMIIMIMGRFAIPSSHSELLYDEYLGEFKYTVALCKEVLEYEGARKKAVFHFDVVGVVTALFMTATRCRDRVVRRMAVALLRKYPRREGLWDSAMATNLAAWFIATEEQGLEGDFVPESARLRVVSNDFDLSNRKAVVKCSKQIPGCEQRILLPEVVIRW